MGEGADRVTDGAAGQHVRQVSREIESLRGELGTLVAELDRRRHELFDLGLQVRRHPVAVAVAAATGALLLGGLVALAVRGRRERRRPVVRARETRRALARLLDHPDRVAAEPSVGQKILAAAGAAAGTALAKRMIDRYVVARPVPRRRVPTEVAARA
jgi:hypothetical protein